ncbi:hsp70 family chaperone [Stagonosporopsis vannaccii]|nr:hsp70 family chaperone [Stagonosporopsis vannaccii]
MDRPDLVVSVDFGMTCTGVAYCNMSTGSDAVRHIQRWPGRTQANENKVPTLLVYPQGSSNPSSWGFLAETAQELSGAGHDSREWFKIMLDDNLLEQMRTKASRPSEVPQIHEVEKWYTDYFRYLYRTIEARLKGELASTWEDAKIEFIFSVPTTWRPLPTVERFRKIIAASGFGSYPCHKATIGLTEAEAAAVHTARSMPGIFNENEILFVCDVGGGTTDLSVFRVKNTIGGSLNLEQLDTVFGAAIGAAQLDNLFQNAVLERLQLADRAMPTGLADLTTAAWEMRISKEYQNAKCDYGSEESLADTETFSVRIPNLNLGYTNQQYEISGGDMYFQRDSLKDFFDLQISKLFDLMDKQLLRLLRKHPNEQVAHLVLSGGLGNSAYVQSCLRTKYAFGNSTHSNAQSIQIRVAPDPQLVVCKGNVADRVAKLKSGQSVLGWRCCRASYGTKCKILYNANNPQHIGQRTEIDLLDGKAYVVDCVDWFIKKGEPVSSDYPIVRDFSRKCPPATSAIPDPPRIFPTDVICSEADTELLPYTMNSTCRSMCKVESDFASVPLSQFKLKNRHWWNSGKKYHRINFVIKVNLGPADLSFELWHNGVKLSKDNTIKVEWQAAAPPEPNQNSVESDFPMNSLPAATNRGNALARKSFQHLGGMNGYAAAPPGGYQGYSNGWESKTGVRMNVTPTHQNGSRVW